MLASSVAFASHSNPFSHVIDDSWEFYNFQGLVRELVVIRASPRATYLGQVHPEENLNRKFDCCELHNDFSQCLPSGEP